VTDQLYIPQKADIIRCSEGHVSDMCQIESLVCVQKKVVCVSRHSSWVSSIMEPKSGRVLQLKIRCWQTVLSDCIQIHSPLFWLPPWGHFCVVFASLV